MIERILVPMDGSRQSEKALKYAVEAARRFNARIFVLRVVTLSMLKIAWNTPTSGGPVIKRNFLKEADQRDKKTMTRIRRYLQRKVKTVSLKGVECSYCILVGDPADSIKACCKKEKIDLVIMNTNGKGWLKRAIMGSVTDEVLRTSRVPVLVIRPDSGKKR